MEYLSLYDYLGRAAGPKLGLEVKKFADEQGIPFLMKDVPHAGFTGKVITYPKDFLDFHFRTPQLHPTPEDYTNREEPKDDLPF